MKKLLIILALGLLTFSACKKDKTTEPPPPPPTHDVRFVNSSSHPYYLTVDAKSKGTVSGRHYVVINLKEGYHTWAVKQKSGYAVYPTKRSGSFNLTDEKIVTFP